MTEYSKNSRNMKAETVSNTGGNSGQGPTHPYSGHSESPSHYSDGGSLRQDVQQSPQDGFELAIQYIMPLVNTIKEENEHLKQQRTQIQTEMAELHKLSQGLLQENQQLRKHHATRTQDIRKLIETISINTNEEISDVNHQSFLLKESNHALVKKIQSEMRACAQLQQKIALSNEELQELHHNSNLNEKAHRDLQVKNKQLFYRCEELKKYIERFDNSADNEAVHEVLIDVVNLRNQNKMDILKAKSLKQQHREEKPFVQENYAHLLSQIKELKVEQQKDKEDARAGDKKVEELKIAYGQSVERFTQSYKAYERAKNSINQGEEQAAKLKDSIAQSKARLKKNEPILPQLKQEKQALRAKILAKREVLRKMQDERLQVQQKIQKETKVEVGKLRELLIRNTASLNEQIAQRITPEVSLVNSGIEQSKEEYAELVQEVQDLRESVRKLQNPRKEIIRLEYQLKKLSYKKA